MKKKLCGFTSVNRPPALEGRQTGSFIQFYGDAKFVFLPQFGLPRELKVKIIPCVNIELQIQEETN
uniref:Uncharacterized protein n=1 Tax=Rhizophora mucronata TaxID=61149 RepID=A0A2P2P4M2_RHIMU